MATAALPPPPSPTKGELCGLWLWRPRWLQPLATIRCFIFVVSIYSCLCSALNSGYAVSMISTIEKRFGIGSTLAGFMTSCYEIGYIPAVVIVSYLGGSRRKPRWLASGAVVMAAAAFIFTLPQFISAPYSASLLMKNGAVGPSSGLCQARAATNSSRGRRHPGAADPCEGLQGGFGGQSNTANIFLFVVANVLLGCGASPILTLGTTYIDDHTSPEQAPPLIATIYASSAVGPMLGHLLGALMLQFYVDQFSLDPKRLTLRPGDPEWVGAWWAGFFLLGLVLAMCSLPLFMFPARLPRREPPPRALEDAEGREEAVSKEEGKEDAKEEDSALEEAEACVETADERTYGRRWQDLPRATLQLIRNRVYLVTCTGICFEMAVINAFAVFLPKYIETQFSVPNFTASVLTGACAVPVGALGILAGGLLCRKLGLSSRGAVRLVLLTNLVVLALYALSFIIGCENAPIAGINAPYIANESLGPNVLQHACNVECGGCPEASPAPVCSPDLRLTFLSACHAGCRSTNGSSAFANCSCLVQAGLPPSAAVFRGSCPQLLTENSCASRRLVPFFAFLCLTIFLTALTQNPLLMVTMRSVRPPERAFGLGFQFVILRLFGYIPAPITFGRVIDSTCLHWSREKACPASVAGSSSVAAAAASAAAIDGTGSVSAQTATGRISGSCLFNDVVLFRNKTFGLAMGLKVASLIVYIILLSLLKRDCLGGDSNGCHGAPEEGADSSLAACGPETVRMVERPPPEESKV